MSMLSKSVRYSAAFVPRCFRIFGSMSSGPNTSEVLVIFIALQTTSVVKESSFQQLKDVFQYYFLGGLLVLG